MLQYIHQHISHVNLVPQSFYSYSYANTHIQTYYLEIEKDDLSEFSSKDIEMVQEGLDQELKIMLQATPSPAFCLPYEEEFLRSILLLCQQIKKIKDLPQVLIHYRGISEESIDFSVAIVRVIEKGKEQPFTLTKSPQILRLIPLSCAIVGNVGKNHQKQSMHFIVQCSKTELPHQSLSLLKARQVIADSLTASLGLFRDVNGGLFLQHNYLLEQLRPFLSIEELKEVDIIDTLFYSLTPSIAKSLVSTEHLLTIFRHFLQLRQRKGPIAEKHSFAAFISFMCPKGCSPEEFLLLKPYLQIPDGGLVVCQSTRCNQRFASAICFSSDPEVQTRFIDAARKIIEDKKNLFRAPRVVRFGLPTSTLVFDPTKATDAASGSIIHMLFEGLTRANSDTSYSLAIADSVSISDDKLQYTFSLRPSLWSNKEPVCAHDFVYAWKRVVQPECTNPFCQLLFPIKNAKKIKAGLLPLDALGATALSERTIFIELEYQCPEFPLLCGHWIYSPLLFSLDERRAGWGDCMVTTLPTNGPFQLKEHEPHEHLILEKNPLYWDISRVGPESIYFQFLKAARNARIAFDKEDLDWFGEPFTPQPLSSTKPSHLMCTLPASSVRGIALHVKRPPFCSQKVRKALSLAIHRQSLCVGDEQPSFSVLPKDHSIVDIPVPLPFHMIQAQALFREGMAEQGIDVSSLAPLHCIVSDLPDDRRAACCVASQWEEAFGIKIRLLFVQPSKFLDTINKSSYDLVCSVWQSICKDSLIPFEAFKEKEGIFNFSKWENELFSALITQAENMEEPKFRRHILEQAEQILIEEVPIIPLLDCSLRFIHSSSFPKFILSPFGTLDFQRIQS
jgi:oligopeptide transport system substrate-binding protein